VGVKNLLPKIRLTAMETEIKLLAYGFFGPIFFLWVGIDTNLRYLFSNPIWVLLVIGVSYAAKILASYLVAKKELGVHSSILMGVALGVRFSTSIVIIKILFDMQIIDNRLYSVLIGTAVAFKFIIPFLMSQLIQRWHIGQLKEERS